MKLADIKKLKVPELKSRLQELGLDSKGLKAELVGRLWSALETGGVVHSDTAQKDSTTTTTTVSSKSEKVDSLVQSQKEYSDTATQTDNELGEPTAGLETGQGPGSEQGEEGERQQANEDQSTDGIGRGRAFYEFKEEIKYKRAKLPQILVTEELLEEDPNIVKIDPHNSHLHFEMEPDGASGHPRFWAQFPLLWSGCRLSHGVQQNRVGFEVRLERKLLATQPQEQKDVDFEEFGLRVGWSVDNASLLLGEDHLSFAYDGRGKKVCRGKEADYGEVLSVGDIIGCYASFSTDGSVNLSFHKNGLFLGVAFSLDASVLQGQPLFPHVLCRSCSVRFLLDPTAPPWYPLPPGFTTLTALPGGLKIRAFSVPRSITQCEVVMMVGLPGSGKTHWAKNHINQHPEKHYKLLSIDEVLDCMITSGQRDNKLKQASQCLTELIKLAAKRPENYILDQYNILFSARQYKLQLFSGFKRKVIVIFPSKEEWQSRLSEHQTREGEHIPPTALLKQQASCTLPVQDNFLEELQYVDLSEQQAQTTLQNYKDEARRLLPPVPKHEKKKPHHCRKRLRPHRPPASHKTLCTGLNGWNHLQSWSQQQRYWPTTYLQGYYYDTQNTCNYEG